MNKFFKTIMLTALFVGTADLLFAVISIYVSSGRFPDQMLNYMAGGGIGLAASIKGGTPAAFLGLIFHYIISFLYTLFFFIIFPHVKVLSFNKYLIGMLYGIFVNVSMDRLILPLSLLPASTKPFNLVHAFVDWVIFGIIFGVPIAFNAFKSYSQE